MKFRNYCIVVLGNTEGALDEIVKVSETNPNFLNAKGVLISTFSSIANPNELTQWFKDNDRNFLIFELDDKTSGFNITKKHIHDGLFGFLKNINLDNMDNEFIKTVSVNPDYIDVEPKTTHLRNVFKNKLDPNKIKVMGLAEKQDLLNQLIDFGLENLTEEDKKILPLLVK